MLGRKSLPLALLITAATVALLPGTAMAQPAASGSAIAAAVDRIIANHYSASDLALVKGRPDIARSVPDPAGPTISVSGDLTLAKDNTPPVGVAPIGVPVGMSPAVENCAGAPGVIITQTSILGSIIWRWHHIVGACSDNVNVTRWLSRNDYLSVADGTIQFKELTTDIVGATPRAWTSSHRQRHLEQCFALPFTGCFHIYPWSKLYLYANHTYNYEWGA